MKFSIYLYDESRPVGKRIETLAAVKTLEDAVRAMLSLAEPRMGQEVTVGIDEKRKNRRTVPLAGIACKFRDLPNDFARVYANAKKSHDKQAEEERLATARINWLRQRGGFTGPLQELVEKDAPFRTAFFKNDFEAASLRIQELGLAA